MKRIGHLLLLPILLASCGPSHPLNYTHIEFTDSRFDNYYVLSTMDSSLVVNRVESPAYLVDTIPFDKIHRIFLQGVTSNGEVLGFLGGYAIGIGVYELVATSYQKSHEDGLGGVLIVPFIPVGVIIGHNLTNKLCEIDLYSPDGKEQLYKMLKYRDIK